VLGTLSVSMLAELVDDMERRIRLNSECLVSELARRDELDFAKEQRNQFIWLLLHVQKRRHRHHVTQQRTNHKAASPLHSNADVSSPSCLGTSQGGGEVDVQSDLQKGGAVLFLGTAWNILDWPPLSEIHTDLGNKVTDQFLCTIFCIF